MKTKTEPNGSGKLSMPCPFCDQPALVKLCKPSANPSTKGIHWYWQCPCEARGFFPDAWYKKLDKAKKISLN
jgi:hypothetical protein